VQRCGSKYGINIRKLKPEGKLKLLFEKWVIIQSQSGDDCDVIRGKIQMEAITIAYELKEFEVMYRIATANKDRTCGEEKIFYELIYQNQSY
jgi:hypothetical protein